MEKEIIFECGSTNKALESFEQNKNNFGEIIKVCMESEQTNVDYKLTLENKEGRKFIFIGGFTSGYNGEGCKGTLKVLKTCGFNVDIDYISNNPNFTLEK